MTEEERKQYNDLFYYTEENIFFSNDDFQDIRNQLEFLCEDKQLESLEDDDELKQLLVNWKYKKEVYKTFMPNTFHVYYDNNLYNNVLKFLSLRNFGAYWLNSNSLDLHIYYDKDYCDVFSLKEFKLIDTTLNFKNKYIHLTKNQYFVGNLYEYFTKNDYKFIYEIDENDKDIVDGKSVIHITVKDEDISSLEEIIKKHISVNGEKSIFTCACVEKKNEYRKLINELVIKYTDDKYTVEVYDYTPGQFLFVKDDKVSLGGAFETEYNFKECNCKLVNAFKRDLIEHQYLDKKCVSCSEKVLCLLGISDENCPCKIF